MTVVAVIPYSLATVALGTFRWNALGWIALLAGAVSFWYILLPKKPVSDLLLLVFMAAVWIAKLFTVWYFCPYPKLYLPVLGQLMWFRTGLFAMLSIRRVQGVGFGFWPSKREWIIGVVHFVIFLPVAAIFGAGDRIREPKGASAGWEKTSLLAVATFFGVLWSWRWPKNFSFEAFCNNGLARGCTVTERD